MRGRTIAFRLGCTLGLVAVLFAAIGIHVLHPLFHSGECHPGFACVHHDHAGAQHKAHDDQEEPELSAAHPHCPICEFLAWFQPTVPEPAQGVALVERLSSNRVPARWAEPPAPALCVTSSRAPPWASAS